MMAFTTTLQQIAQGQTLSSEQAYKALGILCSPETPATQRAAFLAMLSLRQATAEELAGFLKYIKQQTIPITTHNTSPIVDIVGTGGDALKTFNISTAASLVVASAGIPVAKHGGRSVTSQAGSADVIQALGMPISDQPDIITQQLSRFNFAFLFAPFFNPLLKELSSLRKELRLRTFLNILAPLANPIAPIRQVIGLYTDSLLPVVMEALKLSGAEHALAVHSADGMDEISLTSPCKIAHLKQGKIKQYVITPEECGLARCQLGELVGGNAEENAQIIRDIFSGKELGAKYHIVLLNAAAGFMVADRATDFAEGIALAKHYIANGSTLALLNALIERTYV
jgi:anthranilate phosphoribosyltransferase